MERQLARMYQEARKELSLKWKVYMKEAQGSIQQTEDDLKAAMESNNPAAVDALSRDLMRQKQELTIGNDRYEGLVRETTIELARLNQASMDYANKQAVNSYLGGFNEEYKELKDAGIRFDLVDKATVERRAKAGDIRLPQKKLDVDKDRQWNTKVINNEITQGIIQGESMDTIAERIFPEISKGADLNDPDVLKKNMNSSIRTARTLVNAAENEGRYDRAVEMEEDGIITQKVWSAVGDQNTRDLHLEMDGQTVDVDEPFIDADGNEMMFPGDSSMGADPGTLYNCRCSYETKVVGFRREDGSINYVDDRNFSREAHEWQIEREKERRNG